jgi:STE24 endopeptidase
MLLLFALAVDVLMTPWPVIVGKQWGLAKVVAVDDLVVMLPFFLGVILYWAVQFPADRAIRSLAVERVRTEGGASRSVWGLGEYLLFNIRYQLLLMVVPMTGILVAYDLAARYSDQLWEWTHLDFVEQVALMIAAGLMFLISPVIIRYVWSTRVLPAGGLRAGLQNICDRIRLRYQEILIWQTDGGVVNACVMGPIPLWRYILLSDGLLETMKEEQIEAVFGHEAGHVKHLHIPFFLLFAGLSMLLVGGMLLLVWNYLPYSYWRGWLNISRTEWNHALDLAAMGMVLLCWVFGFGWVSRRFERQADVFGVRCVGWNMTHCDRYCLVHHPPSGEKPDRKALCPAAADVFAEALHRIAILNGMAPHARSWRHSSIASRMQFVRVLASDRKKLRRFNRTIVLTKMVLVLGTAAGCAVGAYHYWPEEFVDYWFGKHIFRAG